MAWTIEYSDMARFEFNFRKASDAYLTTVRKRLGYVGPVLLKLAEDIYREPGMTPVKTGALRDSTVATFSMSGRGAETEANIEVRQPAENNGVQYLQFVLPPGHGSYPGNDFPARANPPIQAAARAAMSRMGKDIMGDVAIVMKTGTAPPISSGPKP